MSLRRSLVGLVFLSLAALIALSCGSGHKLQSITVSPASADAQNFPTPKSHSSPPDITTRRPRT